MPEELIGGLADIAAKEQQMAARASQRTGVAPPAGRTQQPKPQRQDFAEGFNSVQARAAGEAGVWVDEDDEEPQIGAPELELEAATDEDLDDLADTLEGRQPKERKPKKADETPDEAARARALDRIKLPKALREAMEQADPEEVDTWLSGLVQDQGKTDDALGGRSRDLDTVRAELEALKAQISGTGKKPDGRQPAAGAAPDQQAADDQDLGDLEALRDQDPEVAAALERRDREIARLNKERRQVNSRLQELEKRHQAEAEALRRETVTKVVSQIQDELRDVYPELNDLKVVREQVAPRAAALLKAGVHTDMAAALREAAHGVFAQVVEEDRKALARRSEDPLRTPVSKSHHKATQRARETEASDISRVYFDVRDKHPEWTDRQVAAEAKKRLGKVVPTRPFISGL